ncbi:MAG: hypothetical protein GX811_12260 [Lentisphaerae bacterium]|nr:hypothetical protein [Lentisphaerota bacterium]
MKQILRVFVIMTTCCTLSLAGERLASAQKIYRTNLSKIQTEYKTEDQAIRKYYSDTLAQLLVKKENISDLDGWAAVKKELDRFENSSDIPETALVQSPESLKNLQTSCISKLFELSLAKEEKYRTLKDKYLAHLESLQTSLINERKMQIALEVKKEIDLISSDSYDPFAGTQQQPDSASEQQSESVQDTDESFIIYSGGEVPADLLGDRFKRQSVKLTEHGRRLTSILCDLFRDSSSEEETSKSQFYNTSTVTTGGSTTHCIRLALKTRNLQEIIQSPMVVIQYFARDISAGQIKKITPEQFDVQHIKLSRIEGQPTYIDLPETSTYKRQLQFRSNYGHSATHRAGKRYYGVIVSVFGDDNTLIYQCSTEESLARPATAEMPEESRESHIARLRNRMDTAQRVMQNARQTMNKAKGDPKLRKEFFDAQNEYERARREFQQYIEETWRHQER